MEEAADESWVDVGLKTGAWGGLLGGVVITALAMAGAPLCGQDVWAAAKNPIFASQMHPGFYLPALLGGQFAHLAISIVWALTFGLGLARLNPTDRVIAGPIWGLAVMLSTFYVVLPAFRIPMPLGYSDRLLATIEFLFYGATMGAVSLLFDEAVPRPAHVGHWRRRWRHPQPTHNRV